MPGSTGYNGVGDRERIRISPTLVEISDGKTFATANITSVTTGVIEQARPSPGCQVALIVLGALNGVVGLVAAGVGSTGVAAFFLLVGCVLPVGIGVAWLKALKTPPPIYVLKICSAAGEEEAMRSYDRQEIATAADRLKRAIAQRG